MNKFINNGSWVKNWSGNWSILTCSYFGEQYTKIIPAYTGAPLKYALFIFHREQNTCYFEQADITRFRQVLVKKIEKKPNYPFVLAKQLMKETNKILDFIKKHKKKYISQNDFNKFQNLQELYIKFHVPLKQLGNFLPQRFLKKYFSELEKARKYAEPVYKFTEDFTKVFDSQNAKKFKFYKNTFRSLTKSELQKFFENKYIITHDQLRQRYEHSGLFFLNGKLKLLTKRQTEAIEKFLDKKFTSKKQIVQGSCAYPGIVRGKARIIFNPKKFQIFNSGDILVTGMTRPEYLPLMKKSAGIVTDAGGMLCHAAIVAREIKKPCIIGTESSTKIIKDGMLIELNAKEGRIKIL